MQRGWYGSPITEMWREYWWDFRVEAMTAIASLYTPSGFVIAADGRCRSDDGLHNEFETEFAQKIFPVINEERTFAYSLIGFAGTNNGRFKMADELKKAADTLGNRRCEDGDVYVNKFGHLLQQAINKARRSGRLDELPANEHMPAEIRNQIFRLLLVGYFRRIPRQFETRFVRNEEDRVRFIVESPTLRKIHSAVTGSNIIARLLFEDRDPRFQRHEPPKPEWPTLDWAEAWTRGYIDACGDPLAAEIDPWCTRIGGHTHIAEITLENGFQWRIPPRTI